MRVHFLGIGGSGASAAAAIAQAQGFEVTGCDLEPFNEFTRVFKEDQLFTDHSPTHLGFHPKGAGSNIDPDSIGVDILAVTPAIFSLDPQNPELVAAKEKGIPILTWQQFLGEYLAKDKFVIAVCGTHGKTTTTAMIAQMLEDANFDPTVELGAVNPRWGKNFRIGKGKLVPSEDEGYFVVEADEFNDNFLHLKPDITVVTNIEMDHPEYFKDFADVKESFRKFLLQTRNVVLANLTDPAVAEVLTHGRGTNVAYLDYSKNELNFPLTIPGEFNILNAKAAFQVGLLLRINPSVIQKSLADYAGVGRRFEYIEDYSGAKVYSDFGHHPTEIKVTMQAAREKFPNQRILLIYQPHMFSRTKALFDDFVKVFKELLIDKIFIMDIYQSREKDTGLVSSKQLVNATAKENVTYIGATSEVLKKLKPQIKKGDIVFFMSAGDTDKLAKQLVKE